MSAEQRFWSKIDLDFETGCWNWSSSLNRNGYGEFWFNGTSVRAHRFSFELLKSKILHGLQLDHLCRNRKCVNPNHLEAVTNHENVIRGIGPTAKNYSKTHCESGHEFTKENTYLKKHGGRECRTCMKELQRTYRKTHRNEFNEYRRNWMKMNPSKANEYNQQWRKNKNA